VTYLAEVLADAPLHYWRLADGQSYIAHDIGSTPRHLDVNSPSTAGGYSGVEPSGGSMVADRMVNFLDTITTTASGSLECWAYVMDKRGGLEAGLVLLGNTSTPGDYQLWILSTGAAFGRAGGGGAVALAPLSNDVWHHLVVTYDGASTKLYVDAVLQVSVASIAGIGHGVQVFVGQIDGNGTEPFHGFLAEIAYYNFALSAARVTAHFVAASPTVPVSGLISSYAPAAGSGVVPGAIADTLVSYVAKTYQNAV